MATTISSGTTQLGYNLSSSLVVCDDGILNDTHIGISGNLIVSSGGIVNNTAVIGNYRGQGTLTIASGGIANDTIVSNAQLKISSGGVASNVILRLAFLSAYTSAKLTGKIINQGDFNGRPLSVGGATIDFDLTSTKPGSGAKVVGLSLFSGNPRYSITVNANQMEGIYALAEIYSFDKTIIIVNSAGENLGSLSVGETVTVSNKPYTLNIISGTLSLTIGDGNYTPPQNTSTSVILCGSGVVETGFTYYDTTLAYGNLLISSGGLASDTFNLSGGITILSGGSADHTFVSGGGEWGMTYGLFTVSSGGKANDTFLRNGMLTIYSGGEATKTTVDNGGWGELSGGTAYETIINDGGLNVASNGFANYTTINGGYLSAESAGTANDTTVNAGGSLTVASGGTAIAIRENGGCVWIEDGANATFVANTFSGLSLSEYQNVTVHSGTTATDTTINNGCFLNVYNGGIVKNTKVTDGSYLYVNSGGTANGIINDQGFLYIEKGGKITGQMSFQDDAVVSIYDGAIVDFDLTQTVAGAVALVNNLSVIQGTPSYSLTVSETTQAGKYYLAEGADGFDGTITVNNTLGETLGTLSVGSSLDLDDRIFQLNLIDEVLSLSFYTISSGLIISSYMTAGVRVHDCEIYSNTTLSAGGTMFISSGGLAKETMINGGRMYVFSGGLANGVNNIQYNNRYPAEIFVSSGGIVNNTVLNLGGELTVSSGAVANNTTVYSSGSFSILSGGTANNTTLMRGAAMTVHDAKMNDIIINSGAYLAVSSGGIGEVCNTIINSGGNMHVFSGGTAFNIIENGGYIAIDSGAIVSFVANTFSGLTFYSYDQATAHDGTIASDITINGGGIFSLFSGGIVKDVTVNGGRIFISSGGILTGKMTFSDSATVAVMEDGAIIDFDISNLTPDAEARINNLSQVSRSGSVGGAGVYYKLGWASGQDYTITISNNQLKGTYTLAHGATGFDKEITVQNTSGENLGTISVDRKLAIGKTIFYSLGLSDDALTLTVASNELPTISNIQASITSPTNQDVVLTANFADDFELASSLYKIGENGNWTDYVDGVIVSENTTVFFKAIDAAGNESEVSYVVTNIDKVAPEKPTASADITIPTNTNVLVSAIFSDDSVRKEYSWDTLAWQDYTDAIEFDQNGTIYFRSWDEAGNDSIVTSYSVTNIDKEAPTITLWGDNTTPLQSSTLSATTEAGLDILYSTDQTNWSKYTGIITVNENNTYYFKATDAADNTGTANLTFANIDTTAPGKPEVEANITAMTNTDVIVTATFSEDSAIREYSLNGEVWQEYANGITMTENGTVYFRGTDAAGNTSEIADYTVSNIDKIAPTKPIATADVTIPTNTDVFVTATFSEDTAVKEYSLDNQEWAIYNEPIKFDQNGFVYFRATDAVGNVSDTTVFQVSNIDKIAPEKPTPSANISIPTNANVLVSAIFSDDTAVKEYSFDKQIWEFYTNAIEFDTNGMIYFRGTDDVGNVSLVASYEVSNIDKEAPAKPIVTADITIPTNTDVIVTATFSDDTTIKEYSFDEVGWQEYANGVTMTENGKVYFRGIDEAGNISEVSSYTVENIDKIAPSKPVVSADITIPTNTDVFVTATFSEDTTVKEYSLDNQEWAIYNEPIKFDQNGFVFFRATDAVGNVSDTTILQVSNIDKISPEKPIASASIIVPTNTDVLVSATFSDDTAIKEYSLNEQEWHVYTEAVTLTENGTVFFRGTDEAGNVSDTTAFQVSNIDKVAPENPIVSADIIEATNQDVVVSAIFSDDSAKKEYLLDGQTWTAYEAPIKFTENGTVHFRGTDEAGNFSEVVTYEVTNIDKEAPVKPIVSADIVTITNGDVTVSAIFSDDSSIREYSMDERNWIAYTTGITLTGNDTVFFRGTDAVGNVSDVTSYTVTNIDKIAPLKPIVIANVTEITNGNVIVSAEFSSDSSITEYSYDGQNWIDYTTDITLEENKQLFFHGIDEAGNESEIARYEVTNIDKSEPIITDLFLAQGADNYVFTASVDATDNMTAPVELKYYIRYSANAAMVTAQTTISGLSFTLSEDDIGRTMYYQVGVQDKANNIAWTDVKPFSGIDRTAPVLSGQPQAVYSDYSVSVAWEAASDNIGIAGYHLILNDEVYDLHAPGYSLSGVSAGTYTYQVVAYDEAGNETSSEVQTLTVAPRADLCVLSVQALKGNRLATTISNQDKVTLSIQFGNIGDVKTAATAAYIYCGEVRLAEIAVAGINPNGTVDSLYTIEAGRMTSGIQDIRVVVDANNTVQEYSESNNEKSLNLNVENHSASDLVIGSVQLDQPIYSMEDNATLSFTVKNIGYIEAMASKAYIYDGDTLLGTVDVDAIVAGEETEEMNFSIDTSRFAVGSHVIRVVADGKKSVPETNEENNNAQIQLVVGLSDLCINKLSLSQDVCNTEEDITVSFTVRNSGASKATASVAEIYDGNRFLGAIAINELSAGVSMSKQFIISAGTLAIGQHNLRVVADARTEVEESDETNNSRSANLLVIQKDERPPEFIEVSIQQDEDGYGFTVTAAAADDIASEDDLVYSFRFAETKDELDTAEILNSNTFAVTPDKTGKTMYYQVSATDLAGNTTWCIARSFTVADHSAPEIMNLSASLEDDSFLLTWDATDNVGVSSFKVYFDDELVSTQHTNSYMKESISVGRHTYRIEAYDDAGNMSTTGNMKLNLDDTVAPTIVSVSAVQSEDSYDIAFAIAATDNETQASDIVSRVQYALMAEDVQNAPLGCLNLTLVPEDAGKTLYYRISAADEAGNIVWSNVQSLPIADISAPTVPTGLVGTVNGSDAMLSWTASSDNIGVAGYKIRYGTSEILSGSGIIATDNQYGLISLTDGVYYWQTASIDTSGNASDWSEVKSFRILPEDTFGEICKAEQAFELGSLSGEQTLTGGVISSASDADWFKFTLDTKGTANDYIQIAFDGNWGDLDLYLYSGNGTTLLRSSDGNSGNTERISLKDLAKGTYLLKTVGRNGAMNTFSLSTKKVAGYDMDAYDANGRNDSMEAATVFDLEKTPQATVSDLNLHEAGDMDFYQFTLANMGLNGDSVSISFENSVGDLDLALYDSKGTKVAESAGTGNVERVSFNGLAAGTYYIQVSAAHNAVNEYTLNWNFTSNKVEADALEGQEPYAITESVELTNLSISSAVDGVTQEDTFLLTLTQDGSANSKIRFSNYRSDWNGLKYVVKNSDNEIVLSGTGSEISLNDLSAGDYTLTVNTPVAGSFSTYDISVSLPESAETKWTYMVYMAADSNLDTYALYDLISMQQAKLDSQIDIYVLVDRSSASEYELSSLGSRNKWDSAWSDTRVGKITYNPGATISVDWESWGELDTSSITTFKTFVDWVQDQSKSENYGLIMWDHGMEDGSLCVDGTTDEDWGTALSISDVSAFLSEKGNIPLVIFNNCLLGSEIVATQMTGSTDVIVVSEAESHPQNSTYAYKDFFSTITADMTAQEMAKVLVQNVRQYGDGTQPSMLSAVDVMDSALATALEKLATAVSASNNSNDKTVLINGMAKTLQDGCAYAGSTVYQSDLYDMIVQAMADRRYANTSDGFKTALADLKSVLEEVVLVSKSVPENRGYGIATFNPVLTVKTYAASGYKAQKIGELVRSYLDSNYAANPAWGELLYDLTKTYQSQIGSSVKVASYSVTSIIDIGKDDLISSMDLGCFSGQGEINDGISLLGDVYLGITITSEATSSGGFTLTNDVGTDVSITIIAQDGSPVASGLNAVSFSNLAVGDYIIILIGVDDCTVTLAFEADWMTGVDRFDFAQSKTNEKFANGNGSIAKASSLAAGYYSGLLTYQGDTDWYQIGNVYTEKYKIVLEGAEDMTVAEYDAEGNLIQTAKFADGVYTMTMKSMNYLFVEGNADLNQNQVNAYSVSISGVQAGSDTTPPDAPVASADVTSVTNGDVLVSAQFSDDSVVKEYSLDGQNWKVYAEPVTMTDNGSVFFRGTDEAGNVSEVTNFLVSNIDKVSPEAPIASATATNGNMAVSAAFSDDSMKKEYSFDGETWLEYTAAVLLASNEIVYFRGTDAAGNVSEVTSYRKPTNAPDNGEDDFLSKNGKWNDANIKVLNTISSETKEINLDAEGTIDDGNGKHNMFGNDGTNKDAGDVAKVVVEDTAKLTFSISSTAAGTFYVYEKVKQNGKDKQVTVGKVTVKATSATTPAPLSVSLSDTGNYYVAMIAKSTKKGTSGYYNVNVTGYDASVYEDADDGGNNEWAKATPIEVGRNTNALFLDSDESNFVGFSDSKDYAKLELESSAYMSFGLESDGKVKFTLWKQKIGSNSHPTKVTSKSLPVKGSYMGVTTVKFLDTSKYEYYISMESTDAAKGGAEHYNVSVKSAVFFDPDGDKVNKYVYSNKKLNPNLGQFRTNDITVSGEKEIFLDSNEIKQEGFSNFVGYNDKTDYARLNVATDGEITFTITTIGTGAGTFTVYRNNAEKKKLEVLGKVEIKAGQTTSAPLKVSGLKSSEEYFVSMTAKSTKANASGSVFYNVWADATLSGTNSSALDMPETFGMADTDQNIQDDLSFGGYDVDALADVSSLADLNDKSGWQSLLA